MTADFIKLTGMYGPIYIRRDQIVTVEAGSDDKCYVYAGENEVRIHRVKETPDEVVRRINELDSKIIF